jgi:hypothetical protein
LSQILVLLSQQPFYSPAQSFKFKIFFAAKSHVCLNYIKKAMAAPVGLGLA